MADSSWGCSTRALRHAEIHHSPPRGTFSKVPDHNARVATVFQVLANSRNGAHQRTYHHSVMRIAYSRSVLGHWKSALPP
jgi:hypothetical protein